MATTPGRTTIVTLDPPTYYTQRQAFWLDWVDEMIANPMQAIETNCQLIKGIGWRLQEYSQQSSTVHEQSVAASARFLPSNGNATVASDGQYGLIEIPNYRWRTETGVAQGAQQTTGDLYLRKSVVSSGSFVGGLSSDQSSFPSPDSANDTVPMDRVLLTSSDHRPDEPLFAWLRMPGEPVSRVFTLLFSGVSGTSKEDVKAGMAGTGQYGLILSGDGTAELWERMAVASDYSWKLRRKFRFASEHSVIGAEITVRIVSDAVLSDGGQWTGTTIAFDFGIYATPLEGILDNADKGVYGTPWHYYTIPSFQQNASQLQPARCDLRQDVRADFYVAKHVFYPSGTLTSNYFNVPSPLSLDDPITIVLFGTFPDGSSASIQLYDAAGSALPLQATGGTKDYYYTTFGALGAQQSYYALITLDTSGPSPCFRRMRAYVPPKVVEGVSTPVVLTGNALKIGSYGVSGPDSDPSHETASIIVHDLDSSLAQLATRGEIPIRIEVAYDPLDPTKTSILFTGYVMKATRIRRGAKGRQGRSTTEPPFPAGDWGTYRLTCVGEWAKLSQAIAPRSMNFSFAETSTDANPLPWKVADMVYVLIAHAGYPDSMILRPDSELRFFCEKGEDLVLEQYADIGPFLISLVRDYLGGYLIFDANASKTADPADMMGLWRAAIPPKPPYNNLCQFFTTPPAYAGSDTAPSIAQARYPDVTLGSGQVMKQTWIRKGTLESDVIPPEGNMIIVTGVSTVTVLMPWLQFAMTQTLINWVSARFSDTQEADGHPAPDPSHPDYLGKIKPLFYGDRGLQTAEAVNFAARRIYDMSAHSRKVLRFEAPLVLVTNASDPYQVRPRPLRFGDPVLVDGEQFIVQSCNLLAEVTLGGTRFQHAGYELFSVPALSDYSGASVGRTT